jgi:hypothetical protein
VVVFGGRFGTGGADIDAAAGVVVHEDFGGQAATGVVGAEEEHNRLGGHFSAVWAVIGSL